MSGRRKRTQLKKSPPCKCQINIFCKVLQHAVSSAPMVYYEIAQLPKACLPNIERAENETNSAMSEFLIVCVKTGAL